MKGSAWPSWSRPVTTIIAPVVHADANTSVMLQRQRIVSATVGSSHGAAPDAPPTAWLPPRRLGSLAGHGA